MPFSGPPSFSIIDLRVETDLFYLFLSVDSEREEQEEQRLQSARRSTISSVASPLQ